MYQDIANKVRLQPDCSFTLRPRRDSGDVVETTLVTTVSCPGVFSILPGCWVDDMTTSSPSEDTPTRPALPATTEVNKDRAVGWWFPHWDAFAFEAGMG